MLLLHFSWALVLPRHQHETELTLACCGVQVLPNEEYRFVRRTIIAIILATDMVGHSQLTKVHSWLVDHYYKL